MAKLITFSFATTVDDVESWDEEFIEEADDDANSDSYQDYAMRALYEVMEEAANKYIAEHESMFLNETIVGSAGL